MRPRFHLAFAVTDLDATRHFYEGVLGARVGRTDDRWIDFDFWDHQISAHLVDEAHQRAATNAVDGDQVPTRHFGIILEWEEWEALGARLRDARIPFLVEPRTRFEGEVGEQGHDVRPGPERQRP